MTKIDKIPTEILVYAVDTKSGDTAIAMTLPEETPSTKSHVEWSLRSNPAFNDYKCDIKEYKIKNTGFHISFPENFAPCTSHSYVNLQVESDDLRNVIGAKKTFILQISTKNFIEAIKENSISISSDGALSGEFCFIINKQNVNLLSESMISKDIALARKIGKAISENRGTSNWIPGHIYFLKQGKRYILYLGQFNDFFRSKSYYYGKTYDICNRWGGSILRASTIDKVSGKLFAYIDDPIEFFKNKRFSLKEFLTREFNNIVKDDSLDSTDGFYPLALRDEYSKLSGVDLGEAIHIEDTGMQDTEAEAILKNLCYQKVTAITDKKSLPKVEHAISLVLSKLLKDCPLLREAFLEQKRSQWINATVYSSSKPIKEVEDVMDQSLVRYVNCLFDKNVIELTEKELNDMKNYVFNNRKK